MELIIDGWIIAMAGTVLNGSILLLIIARVIQDQRCHNMGKVRQLLWLYPQAMGSFRILDILIGLIFEVLFMGEIILAFCLLIASDVYTSDLAGYFCGMFMILYTFADVIYLVLYCIRVNQKYETAVYSKKLNLRKIKEKQVIKAAGGGLFAPLFKGMLIFSILILANYVKSVFVTIGNNGAIISLILKSAFNLVFIIWLVLMINGRIKALVVNEKEIIYISWYGKKAVCPINEIQKIEVYACYIFLWRSNGEIFAKFNCYTKGFDSILEQDRGMQ